MTPLGLAARQYVARGHPVFPLAARGKLPAIANPHPAGSPERASCRGECGLDGHGLHDATLDLDRVTRWWTEIPQANVGVRTGETADVLDIDGPEGDQALGDLARRLGVDPTSDGPMVESAHGWHLYFLPSGEGNRAGLLPKVDWRGTGGYVVGAGSVHPSGHVYRHLPGLGLDAPLEPVPGWLLDLLRPPQPASGGPLPIHGRSAHAYGQRALEAELGRLALAPVGGRNHALNKAAFALGQLVGGGELGPAEVASSLLAVALRIGLSEHEAERTISSGMRRGLEHPRSRSA